MDLLKGVRVLDATSVLAGPLCTYLLALSGAEVIKVEGPPSGDFSRNAGPDSSLNERLMGASFLPQNGGKRSISIDLKTDTGKALFRRLAQTADVVVENFRPGVMRRLGLDYERLKDVNPRLIYCAISGFGQEVSAGRHDDAVRRARRARGDGAGRCMHRHCHVLVKTAERPATFWEQRLALNYRTILQRTLDGGYLDLNRAFGPRYLRPDELDKVGLVQGLLLQEPLRSALESIASAP